jgi:hypothetical protein
LSHWPIWTLDYAVPYTQPAPGHHILSFSRENTVYPGFDVKAGPIARTCQLSVAVADLEPYLSGDKSFWNDDLETASTTEQVTAQELAVRRRKLLLVAGECYSPDKGMLEIKCDRFPEYAQNKRWIVDTLIQLLSVSQVSGGVGGEVAHRGAFG